MKFALLRQNIKPWMLPIAMVCGVLLHNVINAVQWVAPYLIFAMLLITYCKVKPSEFRITSLSWRLLAVQIFGALAVYTALVPFSVDLAQGTMICILCPTATAAPVITGMLGGSVARLATFSIVSNTAVALLAPVFFAFIGPSDGAAHLSFAESCGIIASRVAPLILLPLVAAFALRAVAPRVHSAIADHQSLSFYIWAISLIIVVGRAVSFVMSEPPSKVPEMIAIALLAGVACAVQFIAGRIIGRRSGDKIAGAQGLGQKNTVLAIWMALTYLNPISSVGPAAYVAWQNTINSVQLYLKNKKVKA